MLEFNIKIVKLLMLFVETYQSHYGWNKSNVKIPTIKAKKVRKEMHFDIESYPYPYFDDLLKGMHIFCLP